MTCRRSLAPIGLIVALAAGCSSGPAEKPVYKVRGRVTYENKPMAGAVITFHSADAKDRSTPAHATADADGRYALHTYRPDDGAPAGEHIVTIYWPAPRPKAAAGGATADADAGTESVMPTIDRLKSKYNTVGNSPLRATVEPKDNEINFNLP
jgi:hypothetical protein